MAHARIGKIRLKSGGAEIRVLDRATPNPEGSNYRGDIISHARRVAEFDEPGSELVGFFVLGLFSDGRSSTGYRWDNRASPIPRALMPAYVAELIRRDLVTTPEAEQIACDVINRANGFDPGA